MGIAEILTLIISGCALVYTLFRDNTKDTIELSAKVSELETKLAVAESSISRIGDEQDKMKETLKNLEQQIHELDIKIEKIITILETTR